MTHPADLLHLFLPEGPPGSLDRLCARLPGAKRGPVSLSVSLAGRTPEEVLALCLRLGVTARATAITAGRGSG